MKFEKDLDRIMYLLYGKETLSFKKVNIEQIEKLEKISLDKLFCLKFLANGGYVNETANTIKGYDYSLTTKGVIFIRKTSFVRERLWLYGRNFVTILIGILGLVVSLLTIYDFCDNKITNENNANQKCNCCNNSQPHSQIIKPQPSTSSRHIQKKIHKIEKTNNKNDVKK